MNFINNYLKGKFELVYTFWSSFGFYIIVVLFEKVLFLSRTFNFFVIIIDSIALIVVILSTMGVWNSSKNYLIKNKDRVFWGYLAKLYVVVVCFLVIIGFTKGFLFGVPGSQ